MVLAVEKGNEPPTMGSIQEPLAREAGSGACFPRGSGRGPCQVGPRAGLARWGNIRSALPPPGAGGVLPEELPKGLLQVSGHHPAVSLQGAREESHQQTSR